MDFSQAQFEGSSPGVAPPSTACAACQQPIIGQYWSANGAVVCSSCAAQLQAGPPEGGGFVRFFKALLFGTGAGLLGAIGYGAIIYFAQVELALVTILIGWMVGRAVRAGSEHRGGRGYQALAAILTYCFCMFAFVPSIVQGATSAADPMPTAVAIIIAPFISLALPFTGDMGILGTLILGFGVWQGWKEPARAVITVTGPFALGAAAPTAAAAP